MDFRVVLVGFLVGALVGITGMGGGAVMTPILILFGWAKPMMAVGTDLMWGTLTKSLGAVVHYRQDTVDLGIVKRLAMGSVPGALLGLALLVQLHRHGAGAADKLVVHVLGLTLVVVAATLLFRMLRHRAPEERVHADTKCGPAWLTSIVGFVVGFLVSLSSVGSGSLIVASIVFTHPNLPLKRIVGSDIFHAVLLVGVCALGHLEIGNVNLPLLGGLLLGSLPGVWVGSKMSTVFPDRILRPVLACTFFVLGFKLL